MRIPEAEIESLLESRPVARLSTLREDGSPQVIPIVFAWQGACLWSPVDGKPKRGGELGRVANMARDARVCVLLDHYDEDWTRLWWIRIEGRAKVYRGEGVEAEHAEPLAALRSKYPQYESLPLLRESPVLIRIRPIVTRSWRAS